MISTCTALVPVMDTPVLNICHQLNAHKQSDETARCIASIKATINNLSIEGAISILEAFSYVDDTFHYKQNKWTIKDIAIDRYFPECQGRMAHETIVFWFWGGPPNNLQWYEGTLQTFLEDRILYEISVYGVGSIATLIGTDLEATNVPTYTSTIRALGR